MKTTLEIPDELYRQVKVKAATDGIRVTDVVMEGLRLAVTRSEPARVRVELPILKSKERGKPLMADDVKRALEAMDGAEDEKLAKRMRR